MGDARSSFEVPTGYERHQRAAQATTGRSRHAQADRASSHVCSMCTGLARARVRYRATPPPRSEAVSGGAPRQFANFALRPTCGGLACRGACTARARGENAELRRRNDRRRFRIQRPRARHTKPKTLPPISRPRGRALVIFGSARARREQPHFTANRAGARATSTNAGAAEGGGVTRRSQQGSITCLRRRRCRHILPRMKKGTPPRATCAMEWCSVASASASR